MNRKLVQGIPDFLKAIGIEQEKTDEIDPKIFVRAFSEFAKRSGYVPAVTFQMVLHHLGRTPDVVFDVGVRQGTPALYNAFPDTRFILVDPQKSGTSALIHKPQQFDFVNKALGSKPSTLRIKEQKARTTFLERTALTAAPTTDEYDVEVVTLDALIAEYAPTGKIGLKVDVEGYEMEVFRGLQAEAKRIDFILAEVSVRNRFVSGYNFSDLVSLLKEKGFRFYNIMNPSRPRAPRFYDCVFLPEGDPAFD